MSATEPAPLPATPAPDPTGWWARLRARQEERSVRFMAAGALNTAVGLAAYPLLFSVLHLQKYVALGVAQSSCLLFAFTTYKLAVFRTRGNILREFPRFASFYLVNYAANWASLPFMVEVLHINPMVAQLGFTFAVIVGSYFWHRNVTFKPRQSPFGDPAPTAVEDE